MRSGTGRGGGSVAQPANNSRHRRACLISIFGVDLYQKFGTSYADRRRKGAQVYFLRRIFGDEPGHDHYGAFEERQRHSTVIVIRIESKFPDEKLALRAYRQPRIVIHRNARIAVRSGDYAIAADHLLADPDRKRSALAANHRRVS